MKLFRSKGEPTCTINPYESAARSSSRNQAHNLRYILSHICIFQTPRLVCLAVLRCAASNPHRPLINPKPSDILWLGPVAETYAYALCSNYTENLNFAECCFPSFRFVVSVNFDHTSSTELRKRADDFLTNLRKIEICRRFPQLLYIYLVPTENRFCSSRLCRTNDQRPNLTTNKAYLKAFALLIPATHIEHFS